MNTSRTNDLLIFFLLLCGPGLSQEQKIVTSKQWDVSHRLQVAYEQDNNVRESLKNPQASPSLRLLYDAQRRLRLHWLTMRMSYHGGCQWYRQVDDENKLINDLQVELLVHAHQRWQWVWQGWGRLKSFLTRENDYVYGGWRGFAQIKMPAKVMVKLGYGEELLDYARTDFYSYYSPALFFQAQRLLGRHWTLSPQIQYASLQFKRHAFLSGDANYSFWPASYRQQDKVLTMALNAEGVWPSLLLNLAYRYEMDASNSFGYSYHRHIVSMSFVKSAGNFYFRGHGAIQKKRYHDNLLPFYPLQLDTEREESNFIVLDVTRDLCRFMALVLRAAWYQNESPWASLYYQKRLLSFGAEMHF